MPTKPLSTQLVKKIIEENGCFSLIYRRDRHLNRGGRRIYFYFRPHFVVTMKEDKKDLLGQIRDTLEAGKITISAGQARLDTFSASDGKKIVLFLKKYPFPSNTQREFGLWKEAVEIIDRNQKKKVNVEKGKQGFISTWANFNQTDLKRLFRIREEMRSFKKWRKSDYKWTHSLLARLG